MTTAICIEQWAKCQCHSYRLAQNKWAL